MKSHLTSSDLPALAEQTLPPAEQQHWEAHLPSCPGCTNQLYIYQLWMQKAQADQAPVLEPDLSLPDQILSGSVKPRKKPSALRLVLRDSALAAAAVLAGIMIGNWMIGTSTTRSADSTAVSATLTDSGPDLDGYLQSLEGGTE